MCMRCEWRANKETAPSSSVSQCPTKHASNLEIEPSKHTARRPKAVNREFAKKKGLRVLQTVLHILSLTLFVFQPRVCFLGYIFSHAIYAQVLRNLRSFDWSTYRMRTYFAFVCKLTVFHFHHQPQNYNFFITLYWFTILKRLNFLQI